MRVIAGQARGRRLAPVPGGTRPLADRAREGLFSSLGPAVDGAGVLDLFAGTGALGIEALSRGAARATFVDRAASAIRTIHDNLSRTGLADRATVVRSDVLRFLRGPPGEARFDLVLLDPPYAIPGPDLDLALSEVAARWLPEGVWTVAVTRPLRGYTPVIPVNWHVARRLVYGDALVVCYREV
ncbi:MAG: 16S rRNA (guanine(966)-N(2))-methyltransferase RsmD [Actinobacteria bacterium]|nr:16S rRNA (guanine(966)-N(2))-methyltransferase RsmD [Actinomycetota bacterium]